MRPWLGYAYTLLRLIPIFNIVVALLPLVKPKDDLADIPLTPSQRKLLGLPPPSAPPTPGSVYSTPPRYARSPSFSGSSGKRGFSGSSLPTGASPSNYGTPLNFETEGSSGGGNPGSTGSIFSPAASPLIHKAINGARRSSISFASPSSLGGGGFGASTSSMFGGAESPTPAAGKRSSVGLNNKWLYEKGRRSSGNTGLRT
jgi:nucleoporin POM34